MGGHFEWLKGKGVESEIKKATDAVAEKEPKMLNAKQEEYLKNFEQAGDYQIIKYLILNDIEKIIVDKTTEKLADWEIKQLLEQRLMHLHAADPEQDLTEEKRKTDLRLKNLRN